MCITFASTKANKTEPILALNPRGGVTRNPKQGHQWPQNRTHVSAKNFKNKKSRIYGTSDLSAWGCAHLRPIRTFKADFHFSASNVWIGLKCAQPSWPHSHTLAQPHSHSPLPASFNFPAAASFNCTHLPSFDVKQYCPHLASFLMKQYEPLWYLIWHQTVSASLVPYLMSNSICLIWLHLMLRSIYVIWPHLTFNTIYIIGASFGIKPYLPHWHLIWHQTVSASFGLISHQTASASFGII